MGRRKKLTFGGIALAIFWQLLELVLSNGFNSAQPNYSYPTYSRSNYADMLATGRALDLTIEAITGKSTGRNWGVSTPQPSWIRPTPTRAAQNRNRVYLPQSPDYAATIEHCRDMTPAASSRTIARETCDEAIDQELLDHPKAAATCEWKRGAAMYTCLEEQELID